MAHGWAITVGERRGRRPKVTLGQRNFAQFPNVGPTNFATWAHVALNVGPTLANGETVGIWFGWERVGIFSWPNVGIL